MDINAYISSGIIEQYALGDVTPEEASILECVMKHNSEVEKAILEAQETLGDLALAQSVVPAAQIKVKIAGRIEFNKGEKTAGSNIKTIQLDNTRLKDPIVPTVKEGNSNFWMIAASLLLLISLGWGILNMTSKNTEIEALARNNEALKTQIEATQEENNILINSDKIKLLGVKNHPDLLATVLFSADNQVYLKLDNLPQAPSGKEYQLWAIVDGAAVDLGMYNQSSDKLQQMKTVVNPQAFAITLENAGGSVSPTMEQMYVLGNV